MTIRQTSMQEAESYWELAWLLKPQSHTCHTPPPTRPDLLILPKLVYQLGLSILSLWGPFSFKLPQCL